MTRSEVLMTIETEGTVNSVVFHPNNNFCFAYTTGAGIIVFRQLVPPEERSQSEVSSGDFDIDNEYKPRSVVVYKYDLEMIVWELQWHNNFLFLNARNEFLLAKVIEQQINEQKQQDGKENVSHTQICGLEILQRIKVADLPPPPQIVDNEPKLKKNEFKISNKPTNVSKMKKNTQNKSRGAFSAFFYDQEEHRLLLGHDEGWISVFIQQENNFVIQKTLDDAGDYISSFTKNVDSIFVTSGDGTLYRYDNKTLKRLDLSSPEEYDLTCLCLAGVALLTGTLKRQLNVYKQTDLCIPSKIIKLPALAEFLYEMQSGLCLLGLSNGDVQVLLPDPLQIIGVITNIGSLPASLYAVSADQSLGIFGGFSQRLQIIDLSWGCGDAKEIKDAILKELGIVMQEKEAQNVNKIALNTQYKKEKQLYDANGEEIEEGEEVDETQGSYEEFEEYSESTPTAEMFEELSEDDIIEKKRAMYGSDGKLATKKSFFQGL